MIGEPDACQWTAAERYVGALTDVAALQRMTRNTERQDTAVARIILREPHIAKQGSTVHEFC